MRPEQREEIVGLQVERCPGSRQRVLRKSPFLLSPSSKRLIPWNNDAAADWTRARPWTDPSHAIHLQLRCAAVIGELDRWQLDEPPISLSQQENSSLEALP